MANSSRKGGMRASLALSCVGSALLPLVATPLHAQSTATAGEGRTLKGVTVTSTAVDEEPGRQQASPKAVRSVRDTPQTITVLGKDVLQQQNLISLQDALSTVPGITFGAGEGGSGFGDNISLRGFSANNDITLDGIRDSAQYSRSDNFNIEQIEVTNGATSVQNGSGSLGGNINLVSKRPMDRDQAIFQGGAGTAHYFRATADINHHLNDDIAFRLNGMFHRNDIPGRQVERLRRWGIAPAITVGMSGDTQLTLQYVHQEDRNIPQFGVPFFTTTNYRGTGTPSATGQVYVGALPGVDRSAYYGYRNLDTQRINLNQINLILDHAFNDKVSLRNYTRYQEVTQFTITDGPEGTFCLPNGLTVAGVACTTPGQFTPSGGSRGNTRDTRNRILYNQTDLKAVVNTGFIEHTLDLGVSISRENYNARSGNSQRAADGTTAASLGFIPNYDNLNPNIGNTYYGPVNFVVATKPRARIEDYAIYLFDAMKLGSHFEINGGLRLERNEGQSQTTTLVSTPGATFGQVAPNYPASQPSTGTYNFPTTVYNKNTLFSYRVGLVYKPIETVSLYAAFGNSKTPSQTTVNSAGTCSISGVTAVVSATAPTSTCSTRPEGAKNYEIGGKAELFDGGLLLTAAIFRNDRDSYKVASGDPTLPDQQADGHSRVDGILLGASGHITPAWSITANYSYLKSKLIQGVSDKCLANPGSGNCTSPTLVPLAGSALTNAPKHSGSIYTAYFFPFGLTVGYGATYQGKFALNTPTASAPIVFYSQDYVVHNANVSYDLNKSLSLQVNVKNIGNKLYYNRIRANSGWATPGDARSAVFTLTYKM